VESLIDGMGAEMRANLFALGSIVLLSSCDIVGSCENEMLARSFNSSGTLAAVTFNRNCGATTGYNLQISVVQKGEEPEEGGNALVMDHTPVFSGSLKPTWANDDQLTLSIPNGARVFLQKTNVAGVKIAYKKI
jgi:hypothetical protein